LGNLRWEILFNESVKYYLTFTDASFYLLSIGGLSPILGYKTVFKPII